jgi:Domain of unknown function (DUF4388)
MAKGRDNAAESLGDVLELIRVRRQSGSLSVERSQAGRLEEGEIYLQNGLPVFASSGQMSGQEALVWLLGWRKVKFAFSGEAPRPASSPSANTTGENMKVPANTANAPTGIRRPTSSVNPDLNMTPPSSRPTPPRSTTMTPPWGLSASATRLPVFPQNPVASTPAIPGLEWLIPQKLASDRDVLALPLTRPQRSIYLLIDGHRTVADLARCMRKSIQEIERLLSELQERGLVTI